MGVEAHMLPQTSFLLSFGGQHSHIQRNIEQESIMNN